MNYNDFENEIYKNEKKEMTYEKLEQIVASKVLGSIFWMIAGLLVTGTVGFFVIGGFYSGAIRPEIISPLILGALIVEFIVVVAFSAMTFTAKVGTLRVMFIVYSALNGITLSMLGVIYTGSSIIFAFLGTVVLFIVLGLYGYFTKEDLTKYGTMLKAGLIALIAMGIINIFFISEQLAWVSSILGVVIFIIYTAYDINRIKNNVIAYAIEEDMTILDRIEIHGALSLYLDFVNLFIYILRIIGKKK
ncbi:Bax inhibitor-1/YccA family protein [Leptotrichia sp. OH3620_COT-345]|uniref:Bax inhibitor-1/YccA family protein n=1 Tax=Leptotrichia sp. OH3620_COT-345 TaxID=2491048 RepID=UPI000F6506E0|nr:Bax inhibitor-1/YccA family protein [Leptotrichia sp. OH3620_COT-345]RRD38769.1 Bax inhibitor-1/YccA family protein [Leptotrichia sp. OH3620_COT-345]